MGVLSLIREWLKVQNTSHIGRGKTERIEIIVEVFEV